MYLNRRPSVFKTWQWQTGFALFLLGNAATLGALSVIPVSLLSALASVQFVSNTLFTTCALKEKASRNTWVGCALITLALCCIVVFGSHDTKEYTSEELQRNYGNTGVIVYLCCALLALPIAHMLYENCKARIVQEGMNNVSTSVIQLLPFTYALHSAIVGSQAAIFSKTVAALLRTSFETETFQFNAWFPVFAVAGLVLTANFWVNRLNKALRLFPSLVVIPLLQTLWILLAMLVGGLFFGDFADFTISQTVFFLSGVALLLLGVSYLTPSQIPFGSSPTSPPNLVPGLYDEEDDKISTVWDMVGGTRDVLKVGLGLGEDPQFRALSLFVMPLASMNLSVRDSSTCLSPDPITMQQLRRRGLCLTRGPNHAALTSPLLSGNSSSPARSGHKRLSNFVQDCEYGNLLREQTELSQETYEQGISARRKLMF
ncbi:hypothetical protein CYMTET_16431 [Cymbomonas tetramitiformis]|uniref:Probable magnesium transporter n=1 Tax=Cymbomonas tetramitiformis TaxID=36881 RepID=A0AAE0GC92_9CHLO|nr:hypothetical protein CYMTET_16431 [Cymbomonas tetramitiformis]